MTKRRWLIVSGALLVALSGTLVWMATRLEPRMRAEVEQVLSRRLDSTVTLDALDLRLWPSPAVSGGGLAIRYQGRTDLPPFVAVQAFHGSISWSGLVRRRVSSIEVDGLEINIPPRRRAEMPSLGGGNDNERGSATNDGRDNDNGERGNGRGSARDFSIAALTTTNARLSILPREEGKDPRVFDIFSLRITDLSFDGPATFVASLTNPIPEGRIEAEGTLGPLGSEPAALPVGGQFTFDANLGTIKGIDGALDATGRFEGPLDRIVAAGETKTPDFRIPKLRARALPLETTFRAVVDGTSGDVQLERVDVRLAESTFLASGSIVGTKGIKGKRVVLDVTADGAQMEDVMALTVRAQPAPMTGTLQLTTAFDLPQGDEDVIDKLKLAGKVTIRRARFTSDAVQDKVDDLSRRARGQPGNESVDNVASDIVTAFTLERGRLTLRNLNYRIQGATVAMQGTYALEPGTLDFNGTARLDATVSETQTGVRHFLLKPLDPLFRKQGAGTRVAIRISGTIDDPKFGLDLGRTIRGK